MKLLITTLMLCRFAAADQFEAAVIKVAPPNRTDDLGCRVGPGSLQYSCQASLRTLVEYALSLTPFLDVNPPETKVFLISAKLAKPSTEAQLKGMLRDLLVKQFKLVYHFQPQEMIAEFLVVDSGGLKAKPSMADHVLGALEPPPPFSVGRRGDSPPPASPGIIYEKAARDSDLMTVSTQGTSFDDLARYLSVNSNKKVVNGSGLSGLYDYSFTCRDPWIISSVAVSSADTPDIWTALQRQVGLKMVHKKGFVQVLFIDHFFKFPLD